MTKNKHVMVAMIVAPLLAIMSYFATDYIVSEPPVAAEAGESYALLARPNCRYKSGKCTLKNGEVELTLKLDVQQSDGQVLLATSNMPLSGLKIALAPPGADAAPVNLVPMDPEKTAWMMPISKPMGEATEIKLAMETSGRVFYASTESLFFDDQTSFQQHKR